MRPWAAMKEAPSASSRYIIEYPASFRPRRRIHSCVLCWPCCVTARVGAVWPCCAAAHSGVVLTAVGR
eukprot:1817840-Prymnesium_polylepis.1